MLLLSVQISEIFPTAKHNYYTSCHREALSDTCADLVVSMPMMVNVTYLPTLSD